MFCGPIFQDGSNVTSGLCHLAMTFQDDFTVDLGLTGSAVMMVAMLDISFRVQPVGLVAMADFVFAGIQIV